MFRAISDQLCGDESMHGELRALAVEYMRSHIPDFSPFIEDDENIDSYLKKMSVLST